MNLSQGASMTSLRTRILFVLLLLPLSALAIEATTRFDIPAQSLSEALRLFARQAQMQLVYKPESVSQVTSNSVVGEFDNRVALEKLLKDKGFEVIFLSKNTATIRPVRNAMHLVQDTANTVQESNAQGVNKVQAQAADSPGNNIQEILVTATKRTERLQDVPLSIGVVTAEDIDRRGLVSAADYLRGMPGVNQVDDAYGQAIVIRGIATGTQSQNFGAGPTAATYFGETPTTGSAGLLASSIDLKLVDIERIEVLRGPQGTAFGNSSMGGAVRAIPVAPRLDRVEGKLGAGYSSTSGTGGDNYTLQAIGNVPLIADKLAIRATAYKFEESGYYRNGAGSDAAFQATMASFGGQAFATDADEVGATRFTGGRVTVLFQASDDVKFTFSYLTQESEMDGWPLASSGPFEQTLQQVAPEHVRRGQKGGISDNQINIANAVAEFDLHWADLLATYSYIKSESAYAIPYGLFHLPWPASYLATLPHRGDIGEIRLATKFSGAWNFLAGLYLEQNEDNYAAPDIVWFGDPATNFFNVGERFIGGFLERRDLDQTSAFGEVSWQFAPTWTLTGGVRVFEFDRSVQIDTSGPLYAGGASQQFDGKASGSTFRGNLSYKPAENTLLYAGWAQGFRLGKPQAPPPAALCDANSDGLFDGTNVTLESAEQVDSDAVDSFEVGGKLALLDRRLSIDTSLFRLRWSDIPFGIAQPGCPWAYSENLGAALSEGIEFQANFQLTEAVRIDLGSSWLKARLTEDAPSQGLSAGDRLPGSPKINANLGVQYSFTIGGYAAFVRADSIYVGPFYGTTVPLPNSKSGDYVKINTTARLAIKNLDVDFYVHNLTDEDTFTNRDAITSCGFCGYRPRPRTIGMQLGYAFGR